MGPDRIVRMGWEANLSHPAWHDETTGVAPTPAERPEAFARVVRPAWPAQSAVAMRQKAPGTLSRTQLRKRLSRSGLAGEQLRASVDRVMAGPRAGDLKHLATAPDVSRMALGWPVGLLVPVIGRDAARRVLRFVTEKPWCFLAVPVDAQG